ARAEVKTDPATIEMAAQRDRRFARGRNLRQLDRIHRERFLVNLLHQGHIKRPRAGSGIDLRDEVSNLARTTQSDFPAANLPEQKLHQTFDEEQRGSLATGSRGHDFGPEKGEMPVIALEGNGQRSLGV